MMYNITYILKKVKIMFNNSPKDQVNFEGFVEALSTALSSTLYAMQQRDPQELGQELMNCLASGGEENLGSLIDMVRRGASLDVRGSNNNTPLHCAVQSYDTLCDNIANKALFGFLISTMIEHGADINAQNEFGQTPLHYATYYYTDTELVEILLQHNPDTGIRNIDGSRPIDISSTDDIKTLLTQYESKISGNVPVFFSQDHNLDDDVELLASDSLVDDL